MSDWVSITAKVNGVVIYDECEDTEGWDFAALEAELDRAFGNRLYDTLRARLRESRFVKTFWRKPAAQGQD